MKSAFAVRFILLLVATFAFFSTTFILAQTESIWQTGNAIDDALFSAQRLFFTAQRSDTPEEVYAHMAALVMQAQAAYTNALQPTAEVVSPAANDILLSAFDIAQDAIDDQNSLVFAYKRGQIWTSLLWLSYDVTLDALNNEDIETAQGWLTLREYRQATSVTIVDSPAARMLRNLEMGDFTIDEVRTIVDNDLRDAYFFRLRDALNELEAAIAQQYSVRAAEWGGQAQGYFNILHADYTEKQGTDQAEALDALFIQLEAHLFAEDWAALQTDVGAIRGYLADYQAIELSADIIAERGRLLYLFLDLVYVEYRDGVRNGEITIPIEYQETTTFLAQAYSIYEEVRPVIAARNAGNAARLDVLFLEINALVASLDDSANLKPLTDEALNLIQSTLDIDVSVGDVTAIFTVVDTLLDEVAVAVADQRFDEAERTRIEAYGLFESGPELRLANRAPLLMREVEGLFWEGSGEFKGLYTLINQQAGPDEMAETLAQLRVRLDESEGFLGDVLSVPLALLNSAIIIIREGLEAVLIVGAILAYMYKTGTQKRFIGWVLLGVVAAIVLSVLTWVAAQTILTITPIQRELMEGITSLIAVAVLFYVTNWLFHKTYVVDWMQFVREQADKAINDGRALGLAILGFTVVYREGLETVLFYQALLFDADPLPVTVGFAGGSVLILLVAYAMLALSKRLQLKPLFTATTVLMLFLAFSLTGSGIRELQEGGVVGVTLLSGFPENIVLMEVFGLFPTFETLAAQVIFAALVALSFMYSYWQGKREIAAKS